MIQQVHVKLLLSTRHCAGLRGWRRLRGGPDTSPSTIIKETLQGTLTPRGLEGPSFPFPSRCVVVEALSLETREIRESCKGSPGSGRPDEEGVCARLCAKGHLLL